MYFPSVRGVVMSGGKLGPAKKIRRGPSVSEIAYLAKVGTATVDRVLNGRGQVSSQMQGRVLDALTHLLEPEEPKRRRISVICESGDSFNRSLTEAVSAVAWRRQDLDLQVRTFSSIDVQLIPFAQSIEREAEVSDGIIVVSREDPTVMRATRAVMRRGKPVVCLATDLPKSCRSGFVGSNERGAGAAAAELMGNLLRKDHGQVLFIACGTYHAAKDREEGFRFVLANAFPHLRIEQRLAVRNDPEIAYAEVKAFVAEHGAPDGIYSIAGGNSGVGRALVELGMDREVVFIGHELNANSRSLLRSGVMDYLIGRDQEREVMLSLAMIEAVLDGRPYHDRDETQVRIISRHTCE
jgi:LacI family transcriptional regulator